MALMLTMLVVATIPLLLVGGFANDWRAVLGGTAFLFILQLLGWVLFVGLTTGRMPSAYGRSELRQGPQYGSGSRELAMQPYCCSLSG